MLNESAQSGQWGNQLQRIAFLHCGEFSHINDAVAAGVRIDAFDTQTLGV
jgi:hypothetical protein